ncbi:MAG: DMT family transporter [Pseudomonadota bacterium]
MTIAVTVGVLFDTTVKYVALDVSVITITAWRFVFGSVLALSIYLARGGRLPSAEALRFHGMRGFLHVITATSFFWSLTQIALAEATALGFTSALMVPPIARVILGERISPLSVAALVVGFTGALFALSAGATGAPEDGNRLLGAAAALVAALGYATGIVLIRLRTRTEDSLLITMFGNVVPAIILFSLLLISQSVMSQGPPLTMNAGQYGLVALVGFLAFSMWWLMAQAYRHAEAQKLAPFEYLALPLSVLLGWVMFGEQPQWQLYVGALIVVASCLAVAFEDKLFVRPRLNQS